MNVGAGLQPAFFAYQDGCRSERTAGERMPAYERLRLSKRDSRV